MANYFVSYDLNGQHPTHAEMDAHLKKLGPCTLRVLETVWYVRSTKTLQEMYTYVNQILSANDSVLVIDARNCRWRNLLVSDDQLKNCWDATS